MVEYTYEDIQRIVAKEEKRKEDRREAYLRWKNKCIEDGSYTEKRKEYRKKYIEKKQK